MEHFKRKDCKQKRPAVRGEAFNPNTNDYARRMALPSLGIFFAAAPQNDSTKINSSATNAAA
jgi:hypothetical protein